MIKVGVLRGGPSSEYEVSLKSGHSVLTNLPEQYRGTDIFIDKAGLWHVEGVSMDPHQALKRVDVVFNALHGQYGEDGKVQKLLTDLGVAYTGSESLASAVGMNKLLSKDVYKKAGLKTPIHKVVKKGDNTEEVARELFYTFPIPLIVKPVSAGSSVGVSLVNNSRELEPALLKAFEHGDEVMVEECITGKEATCGVVDDFRGESIYTLMPIEIRKPTESPFFDYNAKYSGASEEICPGNFTPAEKEQIQAMSQKAHEALGLRHYSRSDFMVHPKRGVYILETNTLPGLTTESLLPKSLKAVGSNLAEFLDHVLKLALKK